MARQPLTKIANRASPANLGAPPLNLENVEKRRAASIAKNQNMPPLLHFAVMSRACGSRENGAKVMIIHQILNRKSASTAVRQNAGKSIEANIEGKEPYAFEIPDKSPRASIIPGARVKNASHTRSAARVLLERAMKCGGEAESHDIFKCQKASQKFLVL